MTVQRKMANQSMISKQGNASKWSSPFNLRRMKEMERKTNLYINRAYNNDRAKLLTDFNESSLTHKAHRLSVH